MNEFENDKKIEKFIKDNFNTISIKQYFYHQIHTFIKLYINKFNPFKSKLIFKKILRIRIELMNILNFLLKEQIIS